MEDKNLNKKEQSLQEKIDSEFLNKPSVSGIIKPQTDSPLKSLRTYQGDIEEILGKTKGSMSSVVMAEQERRKKEENKVLNTQILDKQTQIQKEEVKESPIEKFVNTLPQQQSTDSFVYNTKPEQPQIHEGKNRLFFYTGLILIVAGIITVWTVYYLKSSNTKVYVETEKPLVVFSNQIDLNLASTTRNNFIGQITKIIQENQIEKNSVEYINSGDILNFLEKITPNMPGELKRSLENKYMIGIYSSNEGNRPFIILSENDFGLSFSGMLAWEKNILSDIGDIFSISQSSTTPFEDEAYKNKDLRIVKDQNKKTVFVYSFIDKNTILITSDEKSFDAILGKYITGKISR